MKRRDFFKSLALAAPLLFLPKFEPVHWKVLRPIRAVPNPAYFEAQFELRFVDMPLMVDEDILNHANGIVPMRGSSMSRGVTVDYVVFKNGTTDVYGYLHERLRMEAALGDNPPRYTFDPVRKLFTEVKPFIEA